jgi:hypothetical protein
MCPVSAAVPMFAGPGWAREAGGLMSNLAVQGERDSPGTARASAGGPCIRQRGAR